MSAPLSVLIVDDEAPARERLERLVGELPGWTVAGTCASGSEALEQAGRLSPSVVLLDIRMPGMSGIETARHLATMEAGPAVVFTTAYDQYALEAFDSRAVGYLLKPIRRDRLQPALEHAARLGGGRPERFSDTGQRFGPRRHVAARVRDELRLIPVEEIVYFRAEHKYVAVRHRRGEDLIDESLRQLEEEFAHAFVRIHRSLLASIDHIDALEKADDGTHRLRMRPIGETLPVSRRQLGELRRLLAAGM